MRKIVAIGLWLAVMPAFAQGGVPAPAAPASSALEPSATPASAPSATASATPAPPPEDIVDLAPVSAVVASGPGLWKVTRGDHVLWILGTLSPLPKRMQWQSREVEAVIAQAQEVIEAPSYEISPKIGAFGKLFLLPAAMRARRNPDGAQLRDVVPAAEYARWQALKARHLGSDRGVESYRPIFAAGTLYKEAIDDVGLTYKNPVQAGVVRFAHQHDVRVTSPKVAIQVRKPKAALQALQGQAMDDGACFSHTLDRVERELGTMRELADAWAVGDLDRMRALPEVSAQYEACADALASAAVARDLGVGDLRTRTRAAWVAAVERALARNRVSVAMLPIGDLLEPQGITAALRQRGYTVLDPESQASLAAGDAQAQPAIDVRLATPR